MADEQQFCTFFLDDRFFGVDVEKVQEVIRYLPITPIPLAPPVIYGLINLRGQIVTAIDLRRLLQLTDRTTDQRPMNIVVQTWEGTFSLLVDRIGDVMQVDPTCFEHPPDTLDGIARELIQGTYKLQGRLLLTLNVEKLFRSNMLNRAATRREPNNQSEQAPV